jgi:hypothetical protein
MFTGLFLFIFESDLNDRSDRLTEMTAVLTRAICFGIICRVEAGAIRVNPVNRVTHYITHFTGVVYHARAL